MGTEKRTVKGSTPLRRFSCPRAQPQPDTVGREQACRKPEHWLLSSCVWDYPDFSEEYTLWRGYPFWKRRPRPWSVGNTACLLIYLYTFRCRIHSLYLHSETCFTMYSNNWISLPNHMKVRSPRIQMPIGTTSCFKFPFRIGYHIPMFAGFVIMFLSTVSK